MGCGLFGETMPGPGVGPNTSVGGLHIDATLGIYLSKYPRATDGPVTGLSVKTTEEKTLLTEPWVTDAPEEGDTGRRA